MENTEAKAIVELAIPVCDLARGELIAVHDSYKVQDLEVFQNGRNRARGILSTPSFEDFKSFVLASNSHQHTDAVVIPFAAPVFVNHKDYSAVAILNFHQDNHVQGHCDHKAVLKLEPTIVWQKLNELKDRKLSQKSFAVMLEDWATVFAAESETGDAINIGHAIHAVRNMVVDANASVSTQVNNISESKSTLENVEAKSKDGKVPAYFSIKDTAYLGLEETTIRLRLVTNTLERELSFSLQIVKEDLLRNEIAEEFKEKVIELLPENPVRIGTFSA